MMAPLLIVLLCSCRGAEAQRQEALRKAVELSAGVTELRVEDIQVGDGEEARPGRELTVHYTGILLEGTEFDSSRDRNQPFTFRLGAGEVIPGWEEGLKGMRVGGIRRLTVPARMAYGSRGHGRAIPPNAALQFDIQLLDVN